jgi:hypothetical protein
MSRKKVNSFIVQLLYKVSGGIEKYYLSIQSTPPPAELYNSIAAVY